MNRDLGITDLKGTPTKRWNYSKCNLITVDKIKNDEIVKYILENRTNSSQFDEIEKREPIIKALVTDEDIGDVREMFDKIINDMTNTK